MDKETFLPMQFWATITATWAHTTPETLMSPLLLCLHPLSFRWEILVLRDTEAGARHKNRLSKIVKRF